MRKQHPPEEVRWQSVTNKEREKVVTSNRSKRDDQFSWSDFTLLWLDVFILQEFSPMYKMEFHFNKVRKGTTTQKEEKSSEQIRVCSRAKNKRNRVISGAGVVLHRFRHRSFVKLVFGHVWVAAIDDSSGSRQMICRGIRVRHDSHAC